MDDQMLEIMQDIRDRIIRIETIMESQVDDIKMLETKVQKHSDQILQAKTSVKILKWVTGFIVLTVPATVAAYIKLIKGV